MSIKDDILALPIAYANGVPYSPNGLLTKAANLAEIRERELLAQIGQILNHLSNLQRYNKETCAGDSYMAPTKNGDWVDSVIIDAIIKKYEVVK